MTNIRRSRMVLLLAFTLVGNSMAAAQNEAPAQSGVPSGTGDVTEHNVTFSKDIAPLMYRACSQCHHPGQAAPFSLLSYEDARKRAKQLADVTAKKIMPPWLPMPTEHPFMDRRVLSPLEIDMFQRWSELGAPEGDPTQTPPPPVFTSEWKLGEPDLVLEMPEDFEIYAEGDDIYHNFVLPVSIPDGKFLKALEFRPSNRAVVHHALICLDSSGFGRRSDARTKEQGFPGMRAGYQMQFLLPYALGSFPRPFPDGVTVPVPPNSDLVMLMHFHPTGKPEKERSRLGLYLTDTPPTRFMTEIPIPFAFGLNSGMDIPAGEKHYVLKESFTIPAEVEVVGYVPHAHSLCFDMKARAYLPDGKLMDLLWIPHWDFNWQEQYRYETPLHLPANTRIEIEYTYDNSADNPTNPNNPPKRMKWGHNTTDEMIHLGVQVMPVRNEDLALIEEAKAIDREPVIRMFRLRRYAIFGGIGLAVLAIFLAIVWSIRRIRRPKTRPLQPD